jgi:regulator of protease activity HflC (stomatin/prohibitin superfamily)
VFGFVLALVLIIAAVAVLVVARRQSNDSWIPKVVAGALGVLGVALLPLQVFYVQDPGEASVKVAFGYITGINTEQGPQPKAPWEDIISYSIRSQKIEMYSNEGGNGENGTAITAPLAGGANASVSITVLYSIKPDAVSDIYSRFRTQDLLLGNALEPSLRDVVRKESAKYQPLQIKQQRADLGNGILAALLAWEDEYGVIVDQVNLGDISLDPSTEEAISKVIQAQQEVEQARAGLEKAQIEAEKTKTVALADADADQIIRCGATTRTETRTIDGKETEVTVVTPKPVEQCENRLSEQVLYARYIDALKDISAAGDLIVITPEGANGPILNLPARQSE